MAVIYATTNAIMLAQPVAAGELQRYTGNIRSMKHGLWMVALVLCGLADSAMAQRENRCAVIVERLERQDLIDAAFSCDLMQPARLRETNERVLKECSRDQRRRLVRLSNRRASQLEQCLARRLRETATADTETGPARRQPAPNAPGAPPQGQLPGAAPAAVDPGRQRRDTAALVRELLARNRRVAEHNASGNSTASRHREFRSGLVWSYAGAIPGMHCVQWSEPADPHDWDDNYVCSERDVGFQWSHRGPILGRGLNCIQVKEKSDPHSWDDNYFCWPRDLDVTFRFSSTGRIAGQSCLAIIEPSDPHTWRDNYLCYHSGVTGAMSAQRRPADK